METKEEEITQSKLSSTGAKDVVDSILLKSESENDSK